MLSIIQGFIMGNNINNIVQFGHYMGFSTLLIGFMLRHMHYKKTFITIDIDKNASEYTQQWIDKANLEDYCYIITGDSADKTHVEFALSFFNGNPNFIIIDSSHQYEHTLKELTTWYPVLQESGLIILHDAGVFASNYNSSGVLKALDEWKMKNSQADVAIINRTTHFGGTNNVYLDACGLGIINKPVSNA